MIRSVQQGAEGADGSGAGWTREALDAMSVPSTEGHECKFEDELGGESCQLVQCSGIGIAS